MFRLSGVALLTLIGFALSTLFILLSVQTVDSEAEIPYPTTDCAFPIITPRFDSNSVNITHGQNGQVNVALNVSVTRPNHLAQGERIDYIVSLTPLDFSDADELIVSSGSFLSGDVAPITTRFSIPEADITGAGAWELRVRVKSPTDGNGKTGFDAVYVTGEGRSGNQSVVHFLQASEYMASVMKRIRNTNQTLPRDNSTSLDCGCEDSSLVVESPDVFLRPQPDGPLEHPVNRKVTIQVKYTRDLGSSVPQYALPKAKVVLYTTDESLYLYPTWTFTLDSRGRASGVIRTKNDNFPVAAKLVLENEVFTLKDSTGTYEFWLDITSSDLGRDIQITGVLLQETFLNVGLLWDNFQSIRTKADAVVGISDIPHIDLLFPVTDWTNFRPGLIRVLSNHSDYLEILAHEYGHHVMSSLMQGGLPDTGSNGLSHDFCPGSPVNEAFAFVEGYASAFGLKILGVDFYGTRNLATYDCATDMDMTTSEGRVAAGMLDLMDDGVECNGGNVNRGRNGRCDRTTNGALWSPRLVLRDSIVGARVASITAWWTRLANANRGRPGVAEGREAMEYNYYPLPPCRRIMLMGREICIDRILFGNLLTL